MSSRPHVGPFRPDDPVHGESELDAVRRRMESDDMFPRRFEARHEVMEAAAQLIAAGLPKIRRVKTELAQLLGMNYQMFINYFTGSRLLVLDVLSAMQVAGDKVPEARAWCIEFARALVGRWGYTITPPEGTGEVVALVQQELRLASEIAAGTMQDQAGDGVIDAAEAARRLPQARELADNARALEEAYARVASQVSVKGPQ